MDFINHPNLQVTRVYDIDLYHSEGGIRCYANKLLGQEDSGRSNRLLYNITLPMTWHGDDAILWNSIPWPQNRGYKRNAWRREGHRDDTDISKLNLLTLPNHVFNNSAEIYAYRPQRGGETWVNDFDQLYKLLLLLPHIKRWRPELACDCEGVNLSRNGSVTHLSIYILSFDHTWIICLHELNSAVLNTTIRWSISPEDLPIPLKPWRENIAAVFDASVNGTSLRRVLQSTKVGQLWFDIRADADALFKHYGIVLGHVMDIQILELVSRYGNRVMLHGLSKCVDLYGKYFMKESDRLKWLYWKRQGTRFFKNLDGDNPRGWYVLESFPLPEIARKYTAGDVEILFTLYEYFIPRLELISRQLDHPSMLKLLRLVDDASWKRAFDSTTDNYDPHGPNKSTAPIPPADLVQVVCSGPCNRLTSRDPQLEDSHGIFADPDGTYKNPRQRFVEIHGKYRGKKTEPPMWPLQYRCSETGVIKRRRAITWIPPDGVLAALAAVVSTIRHLTSYLLPKTLQTSAS